MEIKRGAAFLVFLTGVTFSSVYSAPGQNLLDASPEQLKKLRLEDLMQVDVISVSRRPQPYHEAAASLQVITQEDIRRSGASSIPEALRLAGNLQVAQIDARQWAISARGFNSATANKLLVMIDGRTVYTPIFSGVFWDAQDYLLDDLERIEVISGPGAALWGANAVNGVINIISKNAKQTQGTLLFGGGGTELRGFGGFRYGDSIGSNVFFRVYGKYFDRESSTLANGRDGKDDWEMGQGGFRMDWEPNTENTLTFQSDFYAGNANQRVFDHVEYEGANFLSRWSRTISDESALNVQFYYDRTQREIPGLGSGDLDTYDIDAQHRFVLGDRHNIVWGLGYRFSSDKLNNTTNLAFLPASLDRHLISGFVQDEILLHEKLSLTIGSKFEHNEYTGFEIQPSVRLGWRISQHHFLWSAVSRAVRTPSRFDTDLFVPNQPPFAVAGGSGFTSEKLTAYELGYRVQPHSRVTGSISVFLNVYDDIRTQHPGPPFTLRNDAEGELYGAEALATWKAFDWWRLTGSYTYLEQDLRVQSGRTDVNNARGEGSDPRHWASLRSAIDLPGNWEFDLHGRWVDTIQTYSGGARGNVPAYFELDVRIGWRPRKDLEFSIVGQNLLHDRHPEFGLSNANRHEIERSVYGKVTWQF